MSPPPQRLPRITSGDSPRVPETTTTFLPVHLRWLMWGGDKDGAEGQNRTVDTSLFRAVLYQLSYLGTRSRNKEVALLQNWPEKIKVPSTNSGEFSPVDRIKHEGLGLSERLQNQDTCCAYPTAFMRIPSVRASLVWRRGRDLNPR